MFAKSTYRFFLMYFVVLWLITEVKMARKAAVLIAYGPCEAANLEGNRRSRLHGLETVLTKEGHIVEFEETDHCNKVELWVKGECVFKCDIRDLNYGGDGSLDPLCQKAAEAVRNFMSTERR